ncbi:SDR family oxidoreductase [Kocuria sp. JC486]|uniref:SDR family oxidoreductase n=1 Tax=Kocuria sp. JC486 TaxID=1970736 RepID=UPI00141E25C5|nr:SDR family oxidoreductase [Kocuria sp. JC486]NHU85309.1 SDR family oxidoreductase [Kocuria sp. JC486]
MTPPTLERDPLPLRGRSVLITGVSRRSGIGYATACRAAAYGANVFCHHYSPHDAQQPWGDDDVDAVLAGVREHLIDGARVADIHADLSDPAAAKQVMDAAVQEFGRVDALVCNHAVSGSDGHLREITAADLDHHWNVNTRASLLLAQSFAAQMLSGTIVLMTSGQNQGPMRGEVAYATAKAALAGITATLADELAPDGIRVNTVNPGPVDTGYLGPEAWESMKHMFPFGRFGEPDDPARLITWLLTDEASWITGQVINSEGGFTR